jgi:hypothetical protein
MGFLKQQHASGMVGMVIFTLVVSLVVRAWWAGGFDNLLIPGKAVENEVVAQMEAYPGNEVLLEQLQTDFPRAYDDLTETLGRAARGPGGEDRVLIAANLWAFNFFASHDRDFAAAPIERLDHVMALQQTFLEELWAHDEYACAAYAKGEAQEEPLPDSFDIAGGEIVAARFAAIKAGRTNQQLRLGLTPAHWQALVATMREKGLNEEQIAVAFGEADPASIGAPLACEMAIELVSAIRAQPQEEPRALLIGAYISGAE